MKKVIIIGNFLILIFIIIGCRNNDEVKKELELKEREIALKEKAMIMDSIKNLNENSIESTDDKTRIATPDNSNKANSNMAIEFGKINFTVTCGARPTYLSFNFKTKSNMVKVTTTDVNSCTMEVNEYVEDMVYFVTSQNDNFKFFTCQKKGESEYKLKYSFMNKKWFLLGWCDEGYIIEDEY